VISLLNRPSHLRKPLLDSLSKYIDGEAISHFVNGTLINHAKYWRNSPIEVSTDVINNQLQMKLVKFLEFSLNLGVELQLVQKVEKNKDITFDEQFNIYSEALFGQNMQLCNIVNLINGPVRRIDNWIEDFLQTPDELSVCYMDNMWFMKKLLKLPDSFDNLFKCYFNQKCIECESVPNQPFICLICGRLLCLDECCAEKLEMDTQDKISEVESVCYFAILYMNFY
jgi:E3 ubiquitin-protein ligase UBR3